MPVTTSAAAAFTTTTSRGATGLSLKNPADEFGVFVRSTATQGCEGCARNAKLFGSNDEAADTAIAHFRDAVSPESEISSKPAAMDNESAFRAEFQESCGHQIEDLLGKNPQHLPVSSGRICQWAQAD